MLAKANFTIIAKHTRVICTKVHNMQKVALIIISIVIINNWNRD